MTRPDSGKESEAATEVDVEVSVSELSTLSREALERELTQLKHDHQKLVTLVRRLFTADHSAFEELRQLYGNGNVPKTKEKPGNCNGKGSTSPSRAVTFSSVQTRMVDRTGPDLKLRREATFVDLSKNGSLKSSDSESALTNRLGHIESYLNMARGVAEESPAVVASSHESHNRVMRMASAVSLEFGSRPGSSISRSASIIRNAQPQPFKNEVSSFHNTLIYFLLSLFF